MNRQPDDKVLTSVRIRASRQASSPKPSSAPKPSSTPPPVKNRSTWNWIVVLACLAVCAVLATQITPAPRQSADNSPTPTVPISTPPKSQPGASVQPTRPAGDNPLMKEIEPVMRRFNEERHWADEKLDTSRLSSVMTGAQLDKQIKVVATLTAAECVWRFDSGSTQVEDIEIINKNQVKVHTRESVKACLYCAGKADPASYDGDFRFVYVVERIAGQWLVSSRILAETFRNERAQSTCPASP